jgi:hypothetical protein
MRFAYRRMQRRTPCVPLGGALVVPRPIICVTLVGPLQTWVNLALVDTGADETVFPEAVAHLLSIDLINAPSGTASGVGAPGGVAVRYAQVTYRLADHQERREWVGWAGFTPVRLVTPLLGYAGCLQYFDASCLSEREIVELTVTSLYPGT